ncbi:MAG: IMP dehydrogenase [Opitutales bacterium]
MKADSDDAYFLPADRFFEAHKGYALTFDDISLATQYSEVLPRETNLETRLSDTLSLQLPIISADMDTVTEAKMAIGMARNGGLGIIHYNMTEREQVKAVARVKNDIHGLIQDPIKVGPDAVIGDLIERIEQKGYKFRTFPVVDDHGKLLGLLPGRVVKQRYRRLTAREAMTKRQDVHTIRQKELGDKPIAVADQFFTDHIGIHKLLVVDDQDILRGLFTLSDIERINEESRQNFKPARDHLFRLLCGAAVAAMRKADGSLDKDRIETHVGNLVDEGVDCLAVSTAHGLSQGVGETVRLLRAAFPDMTLIAGNVTSGAGVDFLAEAGADAIKIGQGPGSICTTRNVAGVGIPQMTALYVASQSARRRGVRLIADGGITKSGDIVKALTLADAVMVGGLLAGCRESPGQLVEINGKIYKQYRGMGSLEAMRAGSAARYGHVKEDTNAKIAAEGVEALKEVAGGLDETLDELAGGIQSGMGYLGAANLIELRQRARYVRMSAAGVKESAPHDVVEVKMPKG